MVLTVGFSLKIWVGGSRTDGKLVNTRILKIFLFQMGFKALTPAARSAVGGRRRSSILIITLDVQLIDLANIISILWGSKPIVSQDNKPIIVKLDVYASILINDRSSATKSSAWYPRNNNLRTLSTLSNSLNRNTASRY